MRRETGEPAPYFAPPPETILGSGLIRISRDRRPWCASRRCDPRGFDKFSEEEACRSLPESLWLTFRRVK